MQALELPSFVKSHFAHLLIHSCTASPQPTVRTWPQGKAAFSLISFNEKAPVEFISIPNGLWDSRGREESFNV